MKTVFAILVTGMMLGAQTFSIDTTSQERFKAKYGRYALEAAKRNKTPDCEGTMCCRKHMPAATKRDNTWVANFTRAKWGRTSEIATPGELACARTEARQTAADTQTAKLQAKLGLTPKPIPATSVLCEHGCCNAD